MSLWIRMQASKIITKICAAIVSFLFDFCFSRSTNNTCFSAEHRPWMSCVRKLVPRRDEAERERVCEKARERESASSWRIFLRTINLHISIWAMGIANTTVNDLLCVCVFYGVWAAQRKYALMSFTNFTNYSRMIYTVCHRRRKEQPPSILFFYARSDHWHWFTPKCESSFFAKMWKKRRKKTWERGTESRKLKLKVVCVQETAITCASHTRWSCEILHRKMKVRTCGI